ncbi:MAG: hypothetical protein JWQ71_989 [Pedosphaera sp.]|nr:hypothetical protein [Pedosphaera sp.]
MDCPNCRSSDTQKAAIGYESGISTLSATGLAVSMSGEFGVGGAEGTQQTLLSQRLSPPSKKSVIRIFLICWCITCFLAVAYLLVAFPEGVIKGEIAAFPDAFNMGEFRNDANAAMGQKVCVLLFSPLVAPIVILRSDIPLISKASAAFVFLLSNLIAFMVAKSNRRWNKQKYPQILQQYNATWFCRKCGEKWV